MHTVIRKQNKLTNFFAVESRDIQQKTPRFMLQGFSVITLLRIWSNYFAAKELFHFRLAMSYYLKHTFRNCESWQDLCLSLSFFAPKRIWKKLEEFGGKSTFTSHLESQEVWAKAKLILKIDQTPLNGHLRLFVK